MTRATVIHLLFNDDVSFSLKRINIKRNQPFPFDNALNGPRSSYSVPGHAGNNWIVWLEFCMSAETYPKGIRFDLLYMQMQQSRYMVSIALLLPSPIRLTGFLLLQTSGGLVLTHHTK